MPMEAGKAYTVSIDIEPSEAHSGLWVAVSKGDQMFGHEYTFASYGRQIVVFHGECQYAQGKTPADDAEYGN